MNGRMVNGPDWQCLRRVVENERRGSSPPECDATRDGAKNTASYEGQTAGMNPAARKISVRLLVLRSDLFGPPSNFHHLIKLPQRFYFDLAHAFASQIQTIANVLKSHGLLAGQSIA